MVNVNIDKLEAKERETIKEYDRYKTIFIECRNCNIKLASLYLFRKTRQFWEIKPYHLYISFKYYYFKDQFFCQCKKFLGERVRVNGRKCIRIFKKEVQITY